MYYNRNPPPYNDKLLGKLFIKKQNGLRGMYLGGKKQKKNNQKLLKIKKSKDLLDL